MPVGFGPRAPLPRICALPSSDRNSVELDGEVPVRRDDPAVADVEHPLLEVVALRGDLDDLPLRSAAAARTAGPTDGKVDEPAESVAYGPRDVSPSDDLDAVERDAELLGGDLRHRRPRAGADVLHRRHDHDAAVRADARPRVRGRPAAAVPDLARHADAALPRRVGAGAHVVPPVPVLLRELVALGEVLRRERRPVVRVRVVLPAQLERIDVELRCELVDEALEPERALDEAGRAERLHRRRVQLRACTAPRARCRTRTASSAGPRSTPTSRPSRAR